MAAVRERLGMGSPARDEDAVALQGGEVLKDGWLAISTKKKARFERRFFLLKKDADCLYHMKSPKDIHRARAVSLVLAQVSPVAMKGQKHTFQIISHNDVTMLKAETVEEMNSWVELLQSTCSILLDEVIEDEEAKPSSPSPQPSMSDTPGTPPLSGVLTRDRSASEATRSTPRTSLRAQATMGLGKQNTIEEFIQLNDYCTECNLSITPDQGAFVSLKLGCALCGDCSVCHRELLGRECSDVQALQENTKSIPVFDPKQNPTSMVFLNQMGNKKSKEFWEANLSGFPRPTANSSKADRMKWVAEKYLQKSFRGQKQGHLSVRHKEKKKAKRYWVVLEMSTMNLYATKDDMKTHDIIVLQSCGVKVGDDPTCPETFTIITPGKTLRLEAANFGEALEWANAISVASASLMKQLTTSIDAGGSKRTAIPTEFVPMSSDRKRDVRPIHRYEMRTDQSEWGRALSSILQLQERLDNLLDSCQESSSSVVQMKMQAIEEQQFEVSNLLFTLPPRDWKSASSQLVRETNSKSVRGGPVEALIEYAISNDAPSMYPASANQFVLTHEDRRSQFPLFMDSDLSGLHNPHALPLRTQQTIFNRNELSVQRNILGFLDSWISSHFYDFREDGNTLRLLLAFLDQTVSAAGFDSEANRLRNLIQAKMIAGLRGPAVSYATTPESILPEEQRVEFLSFQDLDEKEIARQLCLMDQPLFQAIRPQEFLSLAWKENSTLMAPNITRFLQRFQNVTNWVLTSINMVDKPNRSELLGKFIQIAKHCKDMRNFNAVMQIMSAVEDTLMLRFEGTWEGISQKHMPVLLELRKLMAQKDSYNAFKQEMFQHTSAGVPYLQAYLLEMEAVETQEPNFINADEAVSRDINFAKFKKMARLIAEIQRYQRASYVFRPQMVVQQFLNSTPAFSRAELSVLASLTQRRDAALDLNLNSGKLPQFDPPSEAAPVME